MSCASRNPSRRQCAFRASAFIASSAPPPWRTTPTSRSLLDTSDTAASFKSPRSEFSHYVLPEAIDHPLACERDQRDLARLARLEAHGRAGGDIKPHAARLFAIELQRRIGLEKMIVRPDLDRPIAAIGDREHNRPAIGIELDLTVLDEHFAWDHDTHSVILSSAEEVASDASRVRGGFASLNPMNDSSPTSLRSNHPLLQNREGIHSPYRLMHRHQLRSIGERRFDLYVVDHFGNAVHHLLAREHMPACFHQLRDGLAVARAFDDVVGDKRHRLGMIELDASLEPPPSHHRSHGNEQLVLLARGQIHDLLSVFAFTSPDIQPDTSCSRETISGRLPGRR